MTDLTGKRVGARNSVPELRESIEQVRSASLAPRLRALPRLSKMVASFTANLSWFRGGTAVSSNPADTDAEVGAHASVVIGMTGISTWSIYNQAAVTATGSHLVALIKIDNMAAINGINLRVSSDANVTTNYVDLRVSGGNVANSILNGGEWVPVTFSWSDSITTGTVDRSALRSWQFRIGALGGVSTTFRIAWLGVIPARGPYCLVSFDDNRIEANLALAPMAKHGFPGTMYCIADAIGTTIEGASFQTWTDLCRLRDHHGWDLACHAYRLANHNLALGFKSLSLGALDAELQMLKQWALASGLNAADHFAWPKGEFDADMLAVARRYFATAGMATSFVAQAWPTFTPMRLARLSVSSTTAVATVTAAINKALATGTGLELLFHQIVPSGATGSTQYNLADFAAVMDYIKASGIPVRTIRDAYWADL